MKLLAKRSVLTIQFVFLLFAFKAQITLSGKVIDSKTKNPLAFVSIVIDGVKAGTIADIDGKFSFVIPEENKAGKIIFQYLGYATKTISIENIKDKNNFIIELKSTDFSLAEVKVQVKENPAHRIIKLVTANRDNNNPEKMRSFSYISYNKMFVTADLKEKADTVKRMDTTSQKTLSGFLKKQHLFLTESVTERKYKHPGRNNEKVLASRVSGFKNSPFTMLATQ
ncbi:MAG: carboxypeptidase-like regulatory domain-containing protein, partial [Bacteroidia bacterium]|nr:carboxypeptidase-like regulatory domain-containing protein [Bacteroidia bacterium]